MSEVLDFHHYAEATISILVSVVTLLFKRQVNRIETDIQAKAERTAVDVLAAQVAAKATSSDLYNLKESVTRIETKVDRMLERMLDQRPVVVDQRKT